MTATIPVVWATSRTDVPARGYWDQALLIDLLERRAWRPVAGYHYDQLIGFSRLPENTGAVVVVPGGMEPDADWLMDQVARMPWALVIVTSDEGRTFPWWDLHQLEHPHLAVWVQSPHPDGRDEAAHGFLPEGYPTGTPDLARDAMTSHRPLDWAFAGQVTHPRRRALTDVLETLPGDGLMLATDRFAGGVPHAAYMTDLCRARTAPCPGGPVTPDTFRVWEALEAGAVPVVDRHAGERAGMDGYWDLLLRDYDAPAGWPLVDQWDELPRWVETINQVWHAAAARASAWWIGYKRHLAYRLDDQVAALRREPFRGGPEDATVDELVTVVIPSSPVPANPDTSHLMETLLSLAVAGLGGCETIITFDGVRDEQAELAEPYWTGVQRMVAQAMHQWPRVLPVVHLGHQHQARMLRDTLPQVRTPLVLYVEHDCPVDPGIQWNPLLEVMLQGEANLVRFHHETDVLAEHRYLMPDHAPIELGGLRLWRCQQWSQRPHLARTDYYRRVLADHFEPDERHMIEDRMHGVLANADWDDHRVFLYAEPGPEGIRYSRHLDARKGAPKWVDS